MTLSPSHHSDFWGCVSPIAKTKYDSVALGICDRQTKTNNAEINEYCSKNKAEYFLCASGYKCIKPSMFLASSEIVLHTKSAILSIVRQDETITIKTIVVYKNILVSIDFGNADTDIPPIRFLSKPNQMTTITTKHVTVDLNIRICKTGYSHTPSFVSLREPFDNMDVGMQLWFFCLEKHNSFAFYQEKKTGDLYCCSKGCNRSFRTIEEWKSHFNFQVNIPGKFSLAILQEGKIKHHPTAKLRIREKTTKEVKENTEIIKQTITKHSWAWKSLSDTVHGEQMTKDLQQKLTVVKRRRIE